MKIPQNLPVSESMPCILTFARSIFLRHIIFSVISNLFIMMCFCNWNKLFILFDIIEMSVPFRTKSLILFCWYFLEQNICWYIELSVAKRILFFFVNIWSKTSIVCCFVIIWSKLPYLCGIYFSHVMQRNRWTGVWSSYLRKLIYKTWIYHWRFHIAGSALVKRDNGV